MGQALFEKGGLLFAAATLFISFIIIFYNSGEFFGSLWAALLTAALCWISYVMVRLTILAIKK